MVVLGGMGSVTGSIIAAIVLTILPRALREFADYRMLLYSALLIVMMLFKPLGLLGKVEFSLAGLGRALKRLRHKNHAAKVANRLPAERRTDALMLLEAKNLGIAFGGLRALEDLNMKLELGEIVGLIGPNGAGKTTVFNLLTGVYPPTEGAIRLNGQRYYRDENL